MVQIVQVDYDVIEKAVQIMGAPAVSRVVGNEGTLVDQALADARERIAKTIHNAINTAASQKSDVVWAGIYQTLGASPATARNNPLRAVRSAVENEIDEGLGR
ncbi:MAG: hypothetical protein IT567_07290 [Alphaproteobacteria bacterium]|nr:hypothetical protein [Alphaproteobacteria bacterium]